jgi:hypothetical protein
VSPKGLSSSYDPAGKIPMTSLQTYCTYFCVGVRHPRIGLPLHRRILYIILQRHKGGGRPASNPTCKVSFPKHHMSQRIQLQGLCTSASFRRESCSEGNISIGLLVGKMEDPVQENRMNIFIRASLIFSDFDPRVRDTYGPYMFGISSAKIHQQGLCTAVRPCQ